MKFTSIAVTKEFKEDLDKLKVYKKESYMDIIKGLINKHNIENLVVLAAGLGSRFKDKTKHRNKCTFMIKGKPIINNIVDLLKAKNTYVVTGHCEEDIKNSLKNKEIIYRTNPFYKRGILSSIWTVKDDLYGKEFVLTTGDNVFDISFFKEFIGVKGDIVACVKDKKEGIETFAMFVKFSKKGSMLFFDKLTDIASKSLRLIDLLKLLDIEMFEIKKQMDVDNDKDLEVASESNFY